MIPKTIDIKDIQDMQFSLRRLRLQDFLCLIPKIKNNELKEKEFLVVKAVCLMLFGRVINLKSDENELFKLFRNDIRYTVRNKYKSNTNSLLILIIILSQRYEWKDLKNLYKMKTLCQRNILQHIKRHLKPCVCGLGLIIPFD